MLPAVDCYLLPRRHLLGEVGGPLWVGWTGDSLTRSGLRRMCVLRGGQAVLVDGAGAASRCPAGERVDVGIDDGVTGRK